MLKTLRCLTVAIVVCIALGAMVPGVSVALPVVGAMNEGEMSVLLKEGADLFRQANATVGRRPEDAKELYGKAVMRFERIAGEGGIHNGQLYCDIGNAYFRMEDLGRAILNYRRAALYTPNDVNLRQNLEYARSKRSDKVDVGQKTKILNTLFFWHYDLSAKTRALFFLVLFMAGWAAAILRIFLQRSWIGWVIGVTAVLAVLLLGSVAVEEWSMRTLKAGVIVGRDVIARKGDSETYEPSFTEPLHAGTEFEVVEQRPEWYQIELADGRRCWIPWKSSELIQ
ncbi:MAG: tetratricopeptide repeat protein [bacterium]